MREDIVRKIKDEIKYGSENYTCGGTWGWRRAVYLDMTNPTTNCPSGWNTTEYSKRTCGRVTIGSVGTCDSVFFPVGGKPYSQVCGRIRAYQNSLPDAFFGYSHGQTTIDSAYVSGVAVMHGSPRQHIWTFAAGAFENEMATYSGRKCPCDAEDTTIPIPPFVGDDYFCESGFDVNNVDPLGFHSNDVLWDGRDCNTNSTCCSFNDPPYFTKILSETINTGDLELRMCLYDPSPFDNIAVELVELYVK